MAETTGITWTDSTFNPWIGCAKVHTGCLNCYAEADMDTRRGRVAWGVNGTRSKTSADYWKQPIKWNKEAEAVSERRRVFCSSLADVFEAWDGPILAGGIQPTYLGRDGRASSGPDGRLTMADMRVDLFKLIDSTPWLDWQLLTKRPENIRRMWGMMSGKAPIFPGMPGKLGQPVDCLIANSHRPNVWLGTSVSDQATASKAVPELLNCRDLAPVLFLSIEPLVGPVDLTKVGNHDGTLANRFDGNCLYVGEIGGAEYSWTPRNFLRWVIIGGESGHNARPCRPEWIRSIVKQCREAGVPCFVKQLGGNVVTRNDMVEDTFNGLNNGWPDPVVEYDIHGYRENFQGADCRIRLRGKKGGDMSEWPEDLRVREFPIVSSV